MRSRAVKPAQESASILPPSKWRLTCIFRLAEDFGDQAQFEGLSRRDIAVLGGKFIELVSSERAALCELAEALEFLPLRRLRHMKLLADDLDAGLYGSLQLQALLQPPLVHDLIFRVAQVTGVPEATITTYYRSLREAGLVRKAGRGPAASARPTARDAARLLVAVGGARFEKQPADRIVEEYAQAVAVGGAVSWEDGSTETLTGTWSLGGGALSFDVAPLLRLPPHHSIDDAITGLITAAIRQSFSRAIRAAIGDMRPKMVLQVRLYGPTPRAIVDIRLTARRGSEWINFGEDMSYIGPMSAERGDLTITRSFSNETIFAVADLLRDDHYSGVDPDGYPLNPAHPRYRGTSYYEMERLRSAAEAYIDQRAVERRED